MALENARIKLTHIFPQEQHSHYVEPTWCSERLFDVEPFDGSILDPCCGWGRTVIAARAHGYQADGADIVDRGFAGTVVADFFKMRRRVDNIVSNTPYGPARDVLRRFTEHAVRQARRKAALIWPTARLNAAPWLTDLPLAWVLFMCPRPSMPPGSYLAAGNEAKGGRVDHAWLVFEHGYLGPSRNRWLHRDRHQAYLPRATGYGVNTAPCHRSRSRS